MKSGSHPWFDRGKQAIEKLFPGANCYACPLCLREFSAFSSANSDGLSREHVPPRHFGGKKLVLTCKTCNSRAGASLDAHLHKDERFRRIGRSGGLAAKLSVNGGETWVWAELDVQPIAGRIIIKPSGDKTAERRISDQLRQGGAGTLLNFEFKGGIRRRAEISLLRAAYLVAFAKFGFRYILRQVFDPIRRQIESPDSSKDDQFCLYGTPGDEWRLGFVTDPVWAMSVAVQLGSRTVLLPLFDDDDLYARVALAKQQQDLKATLKLKTLPWPSEPEYLFDFDETLGFDLLNILRNHRHKQRGPS